MDSLPPEMTPFPHRAPRPCRSSKGSCPSASAAGTSRGVRGSVSPRRLGGPRHGAQAGVRRDRAASGGGWAFTYRARYAMPDGKRYSHTFGTKMDAEGWLSTERALIEREEWSPPEARKQAEERRQREAATNTVRAFAKRYLAERGLRPNTVRGYEPGRRPRLHRARHHPVGGISRRQGRVARPLDRLGSGRRQRHRVRRPRHLRADEAPVR